MMSDVIQRLKMKAYLTYGIVDFDIVQQDVIRFFSEARLKKYNSAKGVFEQLMVSCEKLTGDISTFAAKAVELSEQCHLLEGFFI